MLTQRVRHRDAVAVLDDTGRPVPHTPAFLTRLYDEELAALLERGADATDHHHLVDARRDSEAMIVQGRHDPV